jgi:hypothetical protein
MKREKLSALANQEASLRLVGKRGNFVWGCMHMTYFGAFYVFLDF